MLVPGTKGQKIEGGPVRSDGVHYTPDGGILKAFLNDDSFISGVRGPFGSGKSTAAIMKLIKNAQEQAIGPDGWRRRRTAIIRNTYPELRTTTMKSWHMWLPQHLGKWREAGPPMHYFKDDAKKFEWEILFLALDRPDDASKILSMDLSDCWVNEAREVPKGIIDALTGRVGRYPPVWQGEVTKAQILLDTNPPDTTSWWYVLAEHDMTNERNRQLVASMLEAEGVLRTKGILRPNQPIMSFFTQPSGRGPNAENLKFLRPGYYDLLMAGKSEDYIKVYVDGEYGFIMEGLPMFPEYRDTTHGSREFPIIRTLGFRIGLDFGFTPAATISQRLPSGRWLVQDELVSEKLGIDTFAKELKRRLADRYSGIRVISVRGDPSGDVSAPGESSPFAIMRANGFDAWPATTQDPIRRREGVAYLLKNLVDGEPAIQIHPRCSWLRKGMAGGYHRRRLLVAGEIKYRHVPEKNEYSHICEALEYDCVSAGEDRHVTMKPEYLDNPRQQYAESDDYRILGG